MRNQQRVINTVLGLVLIWPSGVWAAEVSFSPIPGARMETSVESLLERRWLNIARQGLDISCGSAALATILQSQFDDPVTEGELIKAILERVAQKDVNRRGGFTLLDLKRVAMGKGYKVHGYKLSTQQLAELNTPALIPVTIRGYKHFVVFRGMIGDRVFLADPSFGNIVVRDFLFESIWKNIALVIAQQPGGPIPARLAVTENGKSVTEQDAFRTFMQESGFSSEVTPDEF